jgi:hypothetical protein
MVRDSVCIIPQKSTFAQNVLAFKKSIRAALLRPFDYHPDQRLLLDPDAQTDVGPRRQVEHIFQGAHSIAPPQQLGSIKL